MLTASIITICFLVALIIYLGYYIMKLNKDHRAQLHDKDSEIDRLAVGLKEVASLARDQGRQLIEREDEWFKRCEFYRHELEIKQ